MRLDLESLLCALLINIVTMAVALPCVMGRVSRPGRRAQLGIAMQAVGWAMLLGSNMLEAGSWQDRLVSSISMACLGGSLALVANAFDLWRVRSARARLPTSFRVVVAVAVVMPLGYAIGYSHYAFRVGWSNGLLALQLAMVAAPLVRIPAEEVGRWRWLMVVSVLAQFTVTAWRGVLGAFFTESMPSFVTPHPVNFAFAMVANATAVMSTIGVLSAHRDEAARELERLATIDGLTGVLMRRAWLTRAKTELAVSQRYDLPLAVLMIDLDHFKQINDSRGHEAGDRALAFAAAALQAAVRAGDLVGRYGGEEFCVLMKNADETATHAFDRRLRDRLSPSARNELGFELGYSAGIAMRLPEGDTLEAMLSRADAMLYRAKAQGRARTLDDQGVTLLGKVAQPMRETA